MTNQKALQVLKLFFFGAESVQELSRRTGVSRAEVREILKGARTCDLISFSTQDTTETFVHVRKKGLEKYLRSKGALK